jgi:FkbM family methyltransferase
MSLRKRFARISILRPCLLCAFRFWRPDISIANPWTGHRLSLNSYLHKAYWYYGKGREQNTMLIFEKLVREGDTVIEVGGHIGFITQYFSKLVGQQGKVVVFEPGLNNIRYTEQNVRGLPNTTLEHLAVSSENGIAAFYEDNVTGQNNSLLSDYQPANSVGRSHGGTLVRAMREVEVITIDSYVDGHGLKPDFLKIDVEGSEYAVLLGATKTLRKVRGLMVEVTLRHDGVAKLLGDAGFMMFDERQKQLGAALYDGNVFALRRAQFSGMSPARLAEASPAV